MVSSVLPGNAGGRGGLPPRILAAATPGSDLTAPVRQEHDLVFPKTQGPGGPEISSGHAGVSKAGPGLGVPVAPHLLPLEASDVAELQTGSSLVGVAPFVP